MSLQNAYHFHINGQTEDEINYQPKAKKRKHISNTLHCKNFNSNANNKASTSSNGSLHQQESLDINLAFKSKNYAYVLQELEKDKEFPDNFKETEKNIDDSKAGKELKQFAKKRDKLHKLIIKDDVDGLKKITPIKNVKFYLNSENESALYVAFKRRALKAYAYLTTINADFKDKYEHRKVDFDNKSKLVLQQIISGYASSVEMAHIASLIGLSNVIGEGSKEAVKCFYENLDKIPEISTTLKVLQYYNCLKIVFDFNRENMNHMTLKVKTKGLSNFKSGKVFIAAKSEKDNKGDNINRILGTIAHEFSHMALQIVFENNCNPYYKEMDEMKKEFESIMIKINNLSVIDDHKRHLNDDETYLEKEYHPWKILANVFHASTEEELPCELIVAVPQLLAEKESNREWLNENVPDLMNFYCNTISKCENFVKNDSYTFKKKVEYYNKEEVDILQNLKIFFENIQEDYFLNMADKNLFIIYAENTMLSLLRIFQQLHGKNFFNYMDSYLVLKCEKFLINKEDVDACLKSRTLIIEFEPSDFFNNRISKAITGISKLFAKRPTLKAILIIPDNEKMKIENLLKVLWKNPKIMRETDHNFTLNDLDKESVNNLLMKIVIFQGQKMKLNQIIAKDPTLFNAINVKILGDLCSKEKVEIGGKRNGTSSLEGAYTDVHEEVELGVFYNRIKSKSNTFIAIIYGFVGKEKANQFNEILKEKYKVVKMQENLYKEYKLAVFKGKKILFTERELSNDDFKEFCYFNSHQKIYLINLAYHYKDTTPKFILKQYFNPDFYNERKFKLKTVVKDNRKDVANENPNETFIISGAKNQDVVAPNVLYLDEKEAREEFKKLDNETVHWFSIHDNSWIWRNSNKSVENIRKHITTSKKLHQEDSIITEIENKRVILIADDPGMGKSTSLTKLYEKKIDTLKTSISGENWVIRINLREHLESIKEITVIDLNHRKLVGFFTKVDKHINSDLDQTFLHLAISAKYFLKPLLIVFDGFDEIPNQSERNKVLLLLRYLKINTNCKIWISTRSNFKKELENVLSTFALEFEPFDDKLKGTFIKNYLKHRLDLIIPESEMVIKRKSLLNDYTNKLINKLKEIFGKNSEKFIGTPLQLYLILGNAADSYKNFVSKTKTLDFQFLGDNLIHAYRKFIEMKYNIYFKKINLNVESLMKINKTFFNHFNKALAESIVFRKDQSEFLEEFKTLMLATGILKCTGDTLEFIHFTFCEYYSSEVIMDYLKGQSKLNYTVIDILIREIFLQPEYKSLRNFIRLHLEGIINDLENELSVDNMKSIGEFIKWIWGRNPAVKDKKGTILHVAIQDRNEINLKFIIRCCKKAKFSKEQFYNLFTATNSSSNTIFHIAASIKDKRFCLCLFDEIEDKNFLKTLLQCKNGSKASISEIITAALET